MWSDVLGSFKHILQSFKIQVNNGTWPQSKALLESVILHNMIIEDESNLQRKAFV
jgi:hypothetical protein